MEQEENKGIEATVESLRRQVEAKKAELRRAGVTNQQMSRARAAHAHQEARYKPNRPRPNRYDRAQKYQRHGRFARIVKLQAPARGTDEGWLHFGIDFDAIRLAKAEAKRARRRERICQTGKTI